jgi:adenylate cyclase
MRLQEFWAELRRRRVVRVTAVYGAVSLATIQTADALVPALRLPESATTLVALLLILGFPIAIALTWVLEITPEGIRRTAPLEAGVAPAPVPRRRGRDLATIGIIVVALGAAAWLALGSRSNAAADLPLRVDALAVMPFRVQGADPSLAYLREGMMDLLAATLTGTPRAVDVRAVMAAYRREAGAGDAELPAEQSASVARQLGAARLVTGSIVGSASRVTVSASLVNATNGRTVADATASAPADSLAVLVDRLVATLLSRDLRVAEHRLENLISTSFPAVRLYLEGRSLYRHGRYNEAAERFGSALDIDSTFALAGLGLAEAANMRLGPVAGTGAARGTHLAWAARDRLSAADQRYLHARRGPRYPAPSTLAETIAFWEELTREQPDRPEVWYEYADRLHHSGAFIGVLDHLERADAAFRRAVELDPDYYTAWQHMGWSAWGRGDSALALRHGREVIARDSSGMGAEYDRWFVAIHGGHAELQQLMAGLETATYEVVHAIATGGVRRPFADHDTVMRQIRTVVRNRARSAGESRAIGWGEYNEALRGGRPLEAAGLAAALLRAEHDAAGLERTIEAALYWNGDHAQAQQSAVALAAMMSSDITADSPVADVDTHCMLAQWALWNDDIDAALRTAALLRSIGDPEGDGDTVIRAWWCARVLDAGAAALRGTTNARTQVLGLDSLLLTGPAIGNVNRVVSSIIAARLLEMVGEREAAYHAIRRRSFEPGAGRFLSTLERETGRLAEVNGDRAAAINAYRNYLEWQYRAEPSMASHVEAARAALARLTAER